MTLQKPAPIEKEILDFFADRNFERSRRFSAGAYDPAHLRDFLALLKNPQYTYLTLHIAGTVGKGSTTTYLARAIQSLGFRTGTYTSPHFVSLRERMCVNGAPISAEQLEMLWRELSAYPQMQLLSFFDAMTALAFLWFSRQQCQWAVIETGLGGRLDSTNNLHSRAAVFTRIDFDHRAILGNTLGEIAREKAGIIHKGQNVYTLQQPVEANEVLETTCATQGARLYALKPEGDNFMAINLDFAMQIVCNELGVPAATVKQLAHEIGRPIFGRFTTLSQNPHVIFDCAHNAAGFVALAELVNRQPESQCNFFVNTMKERNLQELTDLLLAKLTKKVQLYLFPMAQALYYQPDDAPADIQRIEMAHIKSVIDMPQTLNIFTGSMAIYAELEQHLAI